MSKQARPNELGLLRQTVRKLAKRDMPVGPFRQDSLRAAGLVRGKITPVGLIGLLPGGNEPLQKLAEALFTSLPGVGRGTGFTTFEAQVFQAVIEQFLERDAATISDADLNSLCADLEQWFGKRVSNRLIFVPCMISPWPSPAFSIGPVHFTFLEEFKGKYADPSAEDFRELHLNSLVEAMVREGAHWMAEIEIDGCDVEQATEIAHLAVDLAIVAIQVAGPNLGVKNMSRLFDRRGTGHVVSVHRSNGLFGGGFGRVDPGTSIGTNYLAKIVHDTKPLMDAVGLLVQSFSTGTYRMPVIEQAWCDAAYWLREGLVEPIDAIAVTKLETAIEVLLRSESSAGSEKRMLMALNTFFGLKPADPVAPNSLTTAQQFAKGFVRDRSRVLHGTWSTLRTRLRTSREALEHVATTLIRSSAVELDLYLLDQNATDNIEAFMLWIAARRGHERAMDSAVSNDGKKCCVFCGATGNLTSEHIWGDWTRKYVPREQNKHDFRAVVSKTPTSETAEPVRIRAGDPLNSQVKVVCQSCNNGWLSQIQSKAKLYLIPLVEGRDAYLGRQAQRQIATWATMATMTGEYLSRDPENVAVPQSERTKFMQTSRPLKNWRIWIGKYEREEWKGQWRHNSFPIYPAADIAEVMTSSKRKPNYQTTSFVVGKLYVHTFSGHASDLIMRWDWQNAPRALETLRQIWPPDKDVVRWPAATMNDQDASGIATAFIRRSAEIANQAGWYPFAQSG